MPVPGLLILPDEAAYRRHFQVTYVGQPIVTFDGIAVSFSPQCFDHAFFRDSSRGAKDKAVFDQRRAERINWIQAVLLEPAAQLYRVPAGNRVRRAALIVPEDYLVVIQLSPKNARRAYFITAFVADNPGTVAKIRSNTPWVTVP